MMTDESAGQSEDQAPLRYNSLEPDSNVTLERAVHCLKQALPSTSTEEGMQIDERDEQRQNASFLIQDN
jgi:hypothetical protein